MVDQLYQGCGQMHRNTSQAIGSEVKYSKLEEEAGSRLPHGRLYATAAGAGKDGGLGDSCPSANESLSVGNRKKKEATLEIRGTPRSYRYANAQ